MLPIDLTLEESTIDPKSPLPSFLEVILLENASESGCKLLQSTIDAIAVKATQYYLQGGRTDGNTARGMIWKIRSITAFIISRLCTTYKFELQLILTYFIEKTSLNAALNNGAFYESLFGLKRSRIHEGKYVQTMKKSDKIKAALLLAMIPYINQRIAAVYEIQRERYRPNGGRQQNGRIMDKIKDLFVCSFPFIHMATEGINIGYNFAYLIGKSIYFNPYLHVLGQVVRRGTVSDMEEKSITTAEKPTNLKSLPSMNFTAFKKSAGAALLVALCVGWMGQLRQELRRRRRMLLERENNDISNGTSRNSTNGINRNDGEFKAFPPPLPPVLKNSDNIDPSLCPLCKQTRVNPVASTSGIVYCFKCIAIYIRENGEKCPVTGMHCKESQLIRIYESSSSNTI